MRFGFTYSPVCFARLMTRVLYGLMWYSCLVFIDDIFVVSKDFAKHLDRLRSVFDRIRGANLKLKFRKYSFFAILPPVNEQVLKWFLLCNHSAINP